MVHQSVRDPSVAKTSAENTDTVEELQKKLDYARRLHDNPRTDDEARQKPMYAKRILDYQARLTRCEDASQRTQQAPVSRPVQAPQQPQQPQQQAPQQPQAPQPAPSVSYNPSVGPAVSGYRTGSIMSGAGPSTSQSAFSSGGVSGLRKGMGKLKVRDADDAELHAKQVKKRFIELDRTYEAYIQSPEASFFGASVVSKIKGRSGKRSISAIVKHADMKRAGELPSSVKIMMDSGYSGKYAKMGEGYEGMCFLQLFLNTDIAGVFRAIQVKNDAVDAVQIVSDMQSDDIMLDNRIRDLWENKPDDISKDVAFMMLSMAIKCDVENWLLA